MNILKICCTPRTDLKLSRPIKKVIQKVSNYFMRHYKEFARACGAQSTKSETFQGLLEGGGQMIENGLFDLEIRGTMLAKGHQATPTGTVTSPSCSYLVHNGHVPHPHAEDLSPGNANHQAG